MICCDPVSILRIGKTYDGPHVFGEVDVVLGLGRCGESRRAWVGADHAPESELRDASHASLYLA
jgi:hypothetical protein